MRYAVDTGHLTRQVTSRDFISKVPAITATFWLIKILRVPLTTLTQWLRSLPGLRTVFARADVPTRIATNLDQVAVVPPPHLARAGVVPQGSTGGRTHQ